MAPNQIRAIRAYLGENQEDFARRLGVRKTTVARWELGIRHPGGSSVVLLKQLWDRMLGEQEAA